MRDTVYFLIFDGFADWQAALALCEIRRPGDWQVTSAAASTAAVVSMAGLSVLPDVSLAQVDLARAAMLIVPGGHRWLRGQGDDAVSMIRSAHAAGIPLAAIDSGVLALARSGALDQVRHTSNSMGQLTDLVPGYAGEDRYDPSTLACSEGGVTTASHLGSVEFAREIIRALDLYSYSDREHWFRLFKHAQLPPWCAAETAPERPAMPTSPAVPAVDPGPARALPALLALAVTAYRPLYQRGLLLDGLYRSPKADAPGPSFQRLPCTAPLPRLAPLAGLLALLPHRRHRA